MPISHAGPLPDKHPELTFFGFDDHSLPFRQNIALHMVSCRKHPNNPIMPAKPGTPDEFALEYGTIMHEEGGRFRYWYLAWENGGPPFRVAYAESDNGVNWERPNLGLVEWRGSTDNNLVVMEPAGSPYIATIAGYPAVLYDPDDSDPNRRYKMGLIVRAAPGDLRDADPVSGAWPAFMTAVSPDGMHWQLTSERPIVTDAFEVGGLYRFGDYYYASGQQLSPWVVLPGGQQVGRVLVTYRSSDFKHWLPTKATSFVRAVQRSTPQGQGEEIHLGAGVWNRGNVLVGLYGQWHGAPEPFGPDITVDLGLIVSNDAVHFREPMVDFKAIPRGLWDRGFLVQSQAFAQVGEETWSWYSATPEAGNVYGLQSHVGLAKWRRDGFGYLAVHDRWDDGLILSCPIELSDGPASVFVNVSELGDGSWIKVEALGHDDQPLPGYGADAAIPITENGVRQPVRWQGHDTVAPPASGFVTLKVTLHAAGRKRPRLYAMYVADA